MPANLSRFEDYLESHGYAVAMVNGHFDFQPVPILAPVEVVAMAGQVN